MSNSHGVYADAKVGREREREKGEKLKLIRLLRYVAEPACPFWEDHCFLFFSAWVPPI